MVPFNSIHVLRVVENKFSPKGGIMGAVDYFNAHRITGVLLILAFISFAIGATLPIIGEKGDVGIFTLPIREYLKTIAGNAVVWQRANVFMGAAAVLLLAGLTILTTLLEGANERVFSRLGLMGILVATVLWLIFSIFRKVVTINAADEFTATGAVPVYYEPLGQWAFYLFYFFAVIGFLALVAYGVGFLQTGLLPGWAGWTTIIFNVAMLVLLLVQGDTLPAFHFLSGLLIGILLMLS